jgi:predicted  nucleic acid-binding Zn-ribbon protein
MKKIKILSMIACFALIFSCDSEDDGQILCTTEAVAGLNVQVKDAETNEILTEGVLVIAQEGEYSEILMNIEQSSAFIGAWERMGDYTITVSKVGYQTYTTDVISVETDVCHVIPEIVQVALIPE